MDDFKSLLNKQVSTLAKQAKVAQPAPAILEEETAKAAPLSEMPPREASPEKRKEMGGAAVEGDPARPVRTPRNRRGGKELGHQLNRVTVNLFDTDKHALATISEKLSHAGHSFTNRSDSIKIGLRLASKASKEDLAALYEKVKKEDRRFRNEG